MSTIIKVENISKQYRLGQVGTGTLSHDINRAWYRIRGKEDPYLKVGDVNDRSTKKGSELVWALKDINFEVKQGEVIGVIGKNGAGKSTLLKILSQVTTPTTGEIKLKGRIAALLEVGTGFHPELTGRENIFLNGAILGMTKSEIKSKFDEIVDFSGVQKYVDTPVKRYSSGMIVRLGFSVAAHLEPEILIVDEVLAVGDFEFQKKCLGKLGDVSKNQGRTILFVSHDMNAISKLTQNSILLNRGTIQTIAPTPQVVTEYIRNNRSKEHAYKDTNDLEVPKIVSVDLETSLPNNIQKHGHPFKIKIKLYTPKTIKSACFSFQVIDEKERNFIHSWIFDADKSFCGEKGFYTLTCNMDTLKLYMGKYSFRLYFTEASGGTVFQVLEYVCPFEVVMYETGRSEYPWQSDTCAYIENTRWDVSFGNQI